MVTPTFADYTDLLLNLFARFWQHACAHPHRGHPFVYTHKALLVFFLVMQQRGLAEALTSDEHFEQAGFKALLRS